MEQNKSHNPKSMPPLGALYEIPPNLLDKLRDLNIKDPSFVSWVLLRSEQLTNILDDDNTLNVSDIKAQIAESLVEAYDIHAALIARQQIIAMFGESLNFAGGDAAQQP